MSASRGLARWRSRLYLSPLYRWRFSGPASERLLLAPQDIRTADPTTASDIYSGHFSFGGDFASADGQSPFAIDAPSPAWERELLGFAWLRHLRAAGHAVAQSQSRALIDDWIALHGRWQVPASWDAQVTARRIMSWISHSPLILQGADHAFYQRMMRSLTRQVRYLRKAAANAPDGVPRLTCIVALNYAGLCMSGLGRVQRQAARRLDEELSRQILPDGGHFSRNPAAIVELLLDLLPLRQTFAAREIAPPEALMNAIDRMMPMVRFFRHGDGSIALFNGVGATPADVMATVLSYDDTFGKAGANAPHSGYQRLAAGDAIVIADAGAPPPIGVSGKAHAGCLSFELSSGQQRIVVNCGRTFADHEEWTRAARTTAAHSTASLGEVSSCTFLGKGRLTALVGSPVVQGPRHVEVTRHSDAAATTLTLSHDGYKPRFGIVHQRILSLDADGTTLRGSDHFDGERRAKDVTFAIRFHLHPASRASLVEANRAVLIVLPGQEIWAFTAENQEIALEESVFLPPVDGPRRTQQIVLAGDTGRTRKVDWVFQRVQAASSE